MLNRDRTKDELYEYYLNLVSDINYWNDQYYKESISVVSDKEFDMKLKELESIENEHPEWITSNSPTQRVGSSLDSKSRFPKVEHSTPMISLENSYNYDDIRRFLNRVRENGAEEIVIESKLDGLSLALIYRKGKLVKAITRGNGKVGEDVLQNALEIRGIPHHIYPEIDIEVRGEVIMSYKAFNSENEYREENALELASNPRNLAAGTLRSLDPAIVRTRKLDFFAYFLMRSSFGWINQKKSLDKLRELGFNVYPTLVVMKTNDIESIMKFIKNYDEYVRTSNNDYPEDGLVIKVNDRTLWDKIGSNSKAPKWAVAYKFEPEEAETKLLDVEIQVGRTGKVTPVAIMEPVTLSGTKVRRATLHNFDEVKRLGVKIGDYVFIEKAAEIIPKVKRVNFNRRKGNEKDIEIPKVCPCCGSTLVKPEYNVDLYCMNKSCPGTSYFKILHFASRQCMDIRGLGIKVLEELFEAGLIKTPADIYRLKNCKYLHEFETLGYKLADNLLDAIEKSKYNPLDRVIFALAIPEIGQTISRKISNVVDDFTKLNDRLIDEMPFLNYSANESLKKWFKDDDNIKLMKELESFGISFVNRMKDKKFTNNALTGKNFVITGSFNKFKNREEVVAILDLFGANVSNNVSKNTDYLIAGFGTENGSKMKKAKELGIEIWDETKARSILTSDR